MMMIEISGVIAIMNNRLFTSENLYRNKRKQVLIHELTHAILHEAGYKEQDEDLVNRFRLYFIK